MPRVSVVAAATLILAAACTSASEGDVGGEGASVGGLDAGISDAELTEAADIVVEGEIVAHSAGAFRDHPDLKSSLTPGERELVDGGYRYAEWTLSVTRWIKGTGESALLVFTPGERAAGVGVEGATPERLPEGGLEAGGSYRFWLSQWEGFIEPTHYIVVRARGLV